VSIRSAAGIGCGGAIPLRERPLNVLPGARMSPAAPPRCEPAAPEDPPARRAGGLATIGFKPLAVRVALRAHDITCETWRALTVAAGFDSASTPVAALTRAPGQCLLRTVRIAIAARAMTKAAALPAPPLAAPAPVVPAVAAPVPVLAVAQPSSEALPRVGDDARARTPGQATLAFRPRKIVVVRRIPVLPQPGYPPFTFALIDVPDFDDDATYIAAKPCEPAALPAVLPRGRNRRPVLVRVPRACGWLNGHLPWPAGVAPVPVAHNGVVLAVKPLLAGREAVLDTVDRVGLATAVGEGWESNRAVRSTSRLFR
jgi:hypothetical protein